MKDLFIWLDPNPVPPQGSCEEELDEEKTKSPNGSFAWAGVWFVFVGIRVETRLGSCGGGLLKDGWLSGPNGSREESNEESLDGATEDKEELKGMRGAIGCDVQKEESNNDPVTPSFDDGGGGLVFFWDEVAALGGTGARRLGTVFLGLIFGGWKKFC